MLHPIVCSRPLVLTYLMAAELHGLQQRKGHDAGGGVTSTASKSSGPMLSCRHHSHEMPSVNFPRESYIAILYTTSLRDINEGVVVENIYRWR